MKKGEQTINLDILIIKDRFIFNQRMRINKFTKQQKDEVLSTIKNKYSIK